MTRMQTQRSHVAVTGVQVLFAFLLVVPFSAEFAKVSDFGRTLLYIALSGQNGRNFMSARPVVMS